MAKLFRRVKKNFNSLLRIFTCCFVVQNCTKVSRKRKINKDPDLKCPVQDPWNQDQKEKNLSLTGTDVFLKELKWPGVESLSWNQSESEEPEEEKTTGNTGFSTELTPQNHSGNLQLKSPEIPSSKKSGAEGTCHSDPEIRSQAPADIISDYDISSDEILGSGAYGVVYAGHHRASGRSVAVKVINKAAFPESQAQEIRHEISILEKVKHPGIIRMDAAFETPRDMVIVMERLECNMFNMIMSTEDMRLSETAAKFIIYQITAAVHYLHEKSIAHCDLKPQNVLLSDNSDFAQAKLCDFGCARVIGKNSFRTSLCGTLAFLAPEALHERGYNHSVDMWALGVTVYVSLTGRLPFHKDKDIESQVENFDLMYPPRIRKNISIEAVDLISKLLKIGVEERYTAAEVLMHPWLRDRELWSSLRKLEEQAGYTYLTNIFENVTLLETPEKSIENHTCNDLSSDGMTETQFILICLLLIALCLLAILCYEFKIYLIFY